MDAQKLAIIFFLQAVEHGDPEGNHLCSPFCLQVARALSDHAELTAFEWKRFRRVNAALKFAPTSYGHEGLRGCMTACLSVPFLSCMKDASDPHHDFLTLLPPEFLAISDDCIKRSIRMTIQTSVIFSTKYPETKIDWLNSDGEVIRNGAPAFMSDFEAGYDAESLYARVLRIRLPTADRNLVGEIIFFIPTMRGELGLKMLIKQFSECREWSSMPMHPQSIHLVMPILSFTTCDFDLEERFQGTDTGDIMKAISQRGILKGGKTSADHIFQVAAAKPDGEAPTRSKQQKLNPSVARTVFINSPFFYAIFVAQELVSCGLIKEIN